MNPPDALLDGAWYWTAWAVWRPLFVHGIRQAPWGRLRGACQSLLMGHDRCPRPAGTWRPGAHPAFPRSCSALSTTDPPALPSIPRSWRGLALSPDWCRALRNTHSLGDMPEQYLPHFLVLGFSEAWLPGVAMTLFVIYRADWVLSFEDSRYLANK